MNAAPLPCAPASWGSLDQGMTREVAGAGEAPVVSQGLDERVRDAVVAHHDFLWRFLRRLGVREAAVDDALQQVFLVAMAKLPQVEPGAERPYLVGVARGIAANARRGQRRAREVSGEIPDVDGGDDCRPDVLVAERETRDLLDGVLAELPEDLREVFVLCELEELSGAEVADLLALPRGTVASRLRRAREEFEGAAKRLRARLARTMEPGRGRSPS